MSRSALIRVHLRLTILTGVLASAGIGCVAPKGAEPALPTDAGMAEAWEARPVAIRIYPATRFVEERGVPMLEARIELFDQMGDSIKSSGQVRFELFAAGDAPGIETGRLLYSWDIALVSLEDQRRYYDPITRGYLLRLETRTASVARRQVMLRATFQPPGGERLVDEQPVQVRW